MMARQSSQRSVRLVCFDLGGVVIRICRSWADGCREAGIEFRGEATLQRSEEERAGLVEAYQTGRIDGPTFFKRVSEALDELYAPSEIRAVTDAWLLGPYNGIERIVDGLHADGVATAALSNTNPDHWSRMSEFPAVMRMRYRLASHELGLNKPDRKIYERTEEITGICGPEILFFDDTLMNVNAARECGWNAHHIDPHSDTARQIHRVLREYGVADGAVG